MQPVFVTLDPQRDTPAVLREYATAFDPRFVSLTGTEDEVRRVANDFPPGTEADRMGEMLREQLGLEQAATRR